MRLVQEYFYSGVAAPSTADGNDPSNDPNASALNAGSTGAVGCAA